MNCAPFDLRDYYFEVLAPDEAHETAGHVASCEACASELERLRLTALTLSALPEEEIPRRIAFVSDKVFEPSSLSRWWQAFWLSGSRMVAAGAFALAAAILVHAYRPATVVKVTGNPVVQEARVAAPDSSAVQALINRAVAQAVAKQDARYEAKLKLVVAESEKQKREIVRAAEIFDAMDRQNRVNTIALNRPLEGGQ